MAEGQETLAAGARGVARERFHYNAQAFRYEAALAEEPALHVPRRVLVAPAGIAVLAFDLDAGMGVSSAKASLQVVDVVGAAVGATLERSLPEGAGMLRPLAIAPSGDRVVTPRIQLGRPVGLVERSTADLSEQAEWGEGLMLGPSTTLHSGVDHWLVCSEQGISLHERGSGTPLVNSACPAGVIPWEASYGSSGKRLALGGERGRVVVLELETGLVRRFWPHPRARRGDSAAVALSSDGHWLASRLHGTESVVVTRLADGVSWAAAPLVDREVPEPPRAGLQRKSQIPGAFAWIHENHLVLADGPEPRVLPVDEPEPHCPTHVSEEGRAGVRRPIRLPRKRGFEELIKAAGLSNAADRLRPWYNPGLLLHPKGSKPGFWRQPGARGSLALGGSRLGGWPDRPSGTHWPTWQGRPMAFLAQIDLAEAQRIQPGLALPQAGLLLFFMGCRDETFEADDWGTCWMTDEQLGSDPGDRGGWQVLYVPAGEGLERTTAPGTPKPQVYRPAPLRLVAGGSPLPHEDTAAYSMMDLSADEQTRYDELLDHVLADTPHDAGGQLGGYPQLIQATLPEVACVQATRGNDPFAACDPEDEPGRALYKAASAWRLILQLGSAPEADFLWGDGGTLSFYGPASDLNVGGFHRSWAYFEN